MWVIADGDDDDDDDHNNNDGRCEDTINAFVDAHNICQTVLLVPAWKLNHVTMTKLQPRQS